MRQFTSPVVVSSIQGEDTFPALSQRTSSSGAASLACLPRDATAVQSSIQKHCRECLFRSFSLCMGPCCFRPLVKACSVHSGGFIVIVDGLKTGSDKSCFSEKAMQLQKWQLDKYSTSDCFLWSTLGKNLMGSVDRVKHYWLKCYQCSQYSVTCKGLQFRNYIAITNPSNSNLFCPLFAVQPGVKWEINSLFVWSKTCMW